MKSTITMLFNEIWPMILIFSVVLVTLRITYVLKNKVKFVLYKELIYLGFIIYIMLLFNTVTFKDVTWSTANYTPFKEIFRYSIGSAKFYRNVIGNMIMFMPYGFFISYFLKLKKPYLVFLLSLIVSITIETTQLVIGRVFDVDDILLNVFGALLGYFIYKVMDYFYGKAPSFLKKDYIYNIITVLALFFLAYLLWGV